MIKINILLIIKDILMFVLFLCIAIGLFITLVANYPNAMIALATGLLFGGLSHELFYTYDKENQDINN